MIPGGGYAEQQSTVTYKNITGITENELVVKSKATQTSGMTYKQNLTTRARTTDLIIRAKITIFRLMSSLVNRTRI